MTFPKQSTAQCTPTGCQNYEPECKEKYTGPACNYFKSPGEQKPQESPLVAPETIKTPEMYQGGEIPHEPLKTPLEREKQLLNHFYKIWVDTRNDINKRIDKIFDELQAMEKGQ